MKNRLEAKLEEAHKQDIDLAPLLDVVFILLIFFIVTTVFVRETGVEVDKPSAVSAEKLERSVFLIAITANGEVIYSGTNIGVEGVRSTLTQASKSRMRPLVIQADKNVRTELLVQVIDRAKLAGIENINLATASDD